MILDDIKTERPSGDWLRRAEELKLGRTMPARSYPADRQD